MAAGPHAWIAFFTVSEDAPLQRANARASRAVLPEQRPWHEYVKQVSTGLETQSQQVTQVK